MNHPYLAVGQEVVFVGIDGRSVKGKIHTVYGPDAAFIELPNGSAIANYSHDTKQTGTFHFEKPERAKE